MGSCPSGTYGEKHAAQRKEDCAPCRAGTYQPAVGQSNHTVCLKCEPGKYSPVGGVATCAYCPAGSWSNSFQATRCTVCPAGQWTFGEGSQHGTDCTPCRGSRFCLGGATARVMIQVLNVDAELISGSSSSLSAVVVGGRRGLKISAFVTVPAGSSANAMAEKLYADSTRELIKQTTEGVLSSSGQQVLLGSVGVQTVAINPEPFSPLQSTTTATTSTRTSTISSTATYTSTSTQRHLDMTTSTPITTMSEAAGAATTARDGHKGAAAPISSCVAIFVWAGLVAAGHSSTP